MKRPRLSSLSALAGLLVVLASCPVALAQPTPRIELEADQVDTDLDATDVTMTGHVLVRGDHFRVTSSSLRLVRRRDGTIEIVGPLVLFPCACDDAPLSFRVDRAVVDAGGNVTLRGASAYVGPVPVLWSPWLALRGPDSWGLVAPRIAWRGADGLLLGAGVHAPLWKTAWLEISPAAYVKGGHDLVSTIHTAGSDSLVRWDRREGRDLVEIQSHGSMPVHDGAVAWTADALRGSRALRGTISLDAAARRFDRADAAVTLGSGRWIVSSGVRGAAIRGVGDSTVGPRLVATRSIDLGARATSGVSIDLSSFTRGQGAWSIARAEADVSGSRWLGDVRADVAARATSMVGVLADGSATDVSSSMRMAIATPIYRAYSPTLVHLVEPSIAVDVAVAHTALTTSDRTEDEALPRALGRDLVPASGAAIAPAVRLENRLGDPAGSGWTLVLGGGAVITDANARLLARGRSLLEARWMRASVDALVLGAGHVMHRDPFATVATASSRAGEMVSGAIDVGPALGPSIGVDGSVRKGVEPIASRMISVVPLLPVASSGWLSAEGASGGATARIPLGERVRVGARVDRDLSSASWLGERVELRYGDRCGCFAVSGIVAHRLGRQGIDAFVTLDIAPR